jgi:hypothetical protein
MMHARAIKTFHAASPRPGKTATGSSIPISGLIFDICREPAPSQGDAGDGAKFLDDEVNALGIMGLGELGNVGANAAVANAVFHATGKRVRDLPVRGAEKTN